MKFRKKPVVIDALQWEGTEESLGAVLSFIQDGHENFDHLPRDPKDPHIHQGIGFTTGEIYIPTLEGTMTARVGDWIIRGVNGEFYPCKPDIFEKTYTPEGE